MARLPLFPLGTVLVPGATLPLQLFEPRYLELLSDLVNAMDVPEFGVVAIRQGHEVGADAVRDLHEVGCVARVQQAAAVGDGRYLVLSTGVRRFRLDALVAGAGTAYLTGEVTFLEERTGDADAVGGPGRPAARRPARLRRHRRAPRSRRGPPTPGSSRMPWARPSGSTSATGSELLAAADTETRLRLGLRLVRRERQLAATLGVVPPTPEHGFNPN